MSCPKISVITVTFNASKTIEACLESVAQQKYPALEHLIIDGKSRDATMNIVRRYAAKYPHVKFVSEPDQGIYDAMNKGIARSNGDWLLFLGADDLLVKNVLNEVTSSVAFEDHGLVYGKIKEFGKRNGTFGAEFNLDALPAELTLSPFIHLFVHHQGTFIRKSLFAEHGHYDLRYRIGADVHFFIKVLGDKRVKRKFVDQYISEVGSDGVSANQDDLIISEEFPALVEKHMNYQIDLKKYYQNFSKYYFHKIYKSSFPEAVSALLGILRISRATKDWGFYCSNTVHWLKRRYQDNQTVSIRTELNGQD
jgi:glycosyltransferase involved in cell wall biosynthesis